jgi:hypothetical protein
MDKYLNDTGLKNVATKMLNKMHDLCVEHGVHILSDLWCEGYFQDRSISASVNTILTPIVSTGRTDMIDGNSFIVPEDGLYVLSIGGGSVPTYASTKLISSLHLGTQASPQSRIAGAIGIYTLIIPSIVAVRYLRSGDTLNHNIFSDNTTMSTINYDGASHKFTFAKISGGIDSLINYPNLWEEGVEYDFGNGMYGQLFEDVYSAGADMQTDIMLISSFKNSMQFQESGGWFYYTNSACLPMNTYAKTNVDTLIWGETTVHGNNLVFRSFYGVARTGLKYRIWVRYTKTV